MALAVLAALGVVYALLVTLARPAGDHPFFTTWQGRRRPAIIAHQGGSGLWPGNTIYAFERAAALGVDVLEMDLQGTADNRLVVIHDPTVDRTTDGTGAVAALTLAQLKKLDAGYRWTPDGGRTFPFRGQGINIPAVEEVLDKFPGSRFNIELKRADPPLIASFCEMLRARGLTGRVLVASFRAPTLDEFRRRCPEVATSASANEAIRFLALDKTFLGETSSPAFHALQVPEYWGGVQVLTPGFIRTARGRRLEVHAWTINDEDTMRRLIDLGVDGIITDYPDRLLKIANQLPRP